MMYSMLSKAFILLSLLVAGVAVPPSKSKPKPKPKAEECLDDDTVLKSIQYSARGIGDTTAMRWTPNLPTCDTATLMNVIIVAGDFDSPAVDDDYEFVNGISFNGVLFSGHCNVDRNEINYGLPYGYENDECELLNHDCGDFDITPYIQYQNNYFNISVDENVGDYCGEDDDTSFMTLVTFYCAGDTVIFSADADAMKSSTSSMSSYSSVTFGVGAALSLMLAVIGGVIAGSRYERKRRSAAFSALAESSHHVEMKNVNAELPILHKAQTNVLPALQI